MVDYTTPFANNGPRRLATAAEKNLGFPDGEADKALFNQLFYALQAELQSVIADSGVAPDDSNYNTLSSAISALISAATGGGDTSAFLLASQAASRLPIYPIIQSADGRIPVITPAQGTVRVPGGVDFLHRGISPQTTSLTDFATAASREYHIRWSPTVGFELIALTDGGYNPSLLGEEDVTFDSGYDSMLVSRVVTDSNNNATITNLANLSEYRYSQIMEYFLLASTGSSAVPDSQVDLNWARTPTLSNLAVQALSTNSGADWEWNTSSGYFGKLKLESTPATRYSLPEVLSSFQDSADNGRVIFNRSVIV